jgi:hypothetical protein
MPRLRWVLCGGPSHASEISRQFDATIVPPLESSQMVCGHRNSVPIIAHFDVTEADLDPSEVSVLGATAADDLHNVEAAETALRARVDRPYREGLDHLSVKFKRCASAWRSAVGHSSGRIRRIK